MNDEKAKGGEAILRDKEIELIVELNHRECLEVGAEAESCDQIQRAAELAILIETMDRHSSLLREVRAALARVDDGSYGRCLRCEDPISSKRLAAVPWASLCLKCQEYVDRQCASGHAESALVTS